MVWVHFVSKRPKNNHSELSTTLKIFSRVPLDDLVRKKHHYFLTLIIHEIRWVIGGGRGAVVVSLQFLNSRDFFFKRSNFKGSYFKIGYRLRINLISQIWSFEIFEHQISLLFCTQVFSIFRNLKIS